MREEEEHTAKLLTVLDETGAPRLKETAPLTSTTHHMKLVSRLWACDVTEEAMPQIERDLRKVAAHNLEVNRGYRIDPDDLQMPQLSSCRRTEERREEGSIEGTPEAPPAPPTAAAAAAAAAASSRFSDDPLEGFDAVQKAILGMSPLSDSNSKRSRRRCSDSRTAAGGRCSATTMPGAARRDAKNHDAAAPAAATLGPILL